MMNLGRPGGCSNGQVRLAACCWPFWEARSCQLLKSWVPTTCSFKKFAWQGRWRSSKVFSFASKMMHSAFQMIESASKLMNFVLNDKLCINNDGLCIKNDGLWIKDHRSCIKTDEMMKWFCIKTDALRQGLAWWRRSSLWLSCRWVYI